MSLVDTRKNNPMSTETKLSPVAIVIFGATGDLVWRKLAPALYNLLLNQQLPEHFAVIGIGRKNKSSDEFRLRLRDGANSFCDCGGVDENTWNEFAPNLSYLSGDFANPATYAALDQQLKAYEKKWGGPANHIFGSSDLSGIIVQRPSADVIESGRSCDSRTLAD
jgi:glucose-6-phosphate 1-dehydrogenase